MRRQDTVLDLICGKTKATSVRSVRGQELTRMKENQIVQTASAQVPDAVGVRRSHGVRKSRDFLSTRPHRVRSLAFQRDAAVRERSRKSPR